MKFIADTIEYRSQNEVESVFFGHEEQELALIISGIPGTSDHYIEWNDQSNACVNGVQKIELSAEALYIGLLPEAAKQLGQAEFSIRFDCDEQVFKGVTECLTRIFHDQLLIKPTDAKKKVAPQRDYSKVKYLNLEGKKLRELPDYVQEMALLETVKLEGNPKMDFQAAFEVLAHLPNIKHLSYSTDGEVPESIGKLAQLETLSITGMTKPCLFPESFGRLKKLKSLLLMSDSDITLPDSFGELTALESLNIRVAGWQLPARFYQLDRLKILDFTNCRFERLPQEIAGMKEVDTVIFGSSEARDYSQVLAVVAQIPNLKVLEWSINPIPKEISFFKKIEELNIWIGADGKAPLHLPDDLFELVQLQTLLLSVNQLKKIPESIGKLKGLKTLVIMGSDLESLPEAIGELSNLEFLNISENPSLKSLPERLGNLTQLKSLNLSDNPNLLQLPEGIKNLTNLESVSISNREMVKHIPDSWSNLFIDQ